MYVQADIELKEKAMAKTQHITVSPAGITRATT
jgi:hypothetical protein